MLNQVTNVVFGIIAICDLLHVIFFRWIIVIIACHLVFYYFKLGFYGVFFSFHQYTFSTFYHHFYTYVPCTESISILVSSEYNVSSVLAALFLKCSMFKRTIC